MGGVLAWRVFQVFLPPRHERPLWLAATRARAAGRHLGRRLSPGAQDARRDDPRP
jgi:hypothetical protein